MKAPVVLVYPHDLVGEIIDMAEGPGSDPSHAVILLVDRCGQPYAWEALGGGFQKSPYTKYDGLKHIDYFVEIPNLLGAINMAESLLGNEYGFTSCLEGEIHDLTGYDVAANDRRATDCSESVVLIVRAGGGEICDDVPAADVTPAALKKWFDAKGIEGIKKGFGE